MRASTKARLLVAVLAVFSLLAAQTQAPAFARTTGDAFAKLSSELGLSKAEASLFLCAHSGDNGEKRQGGSECPCSLCHGTHFGSAIVPSTELGELQGLPRQLVRPVDQVLRHVTPFAGASRQRAPPA